MSAWREPFVSLDANNVTGTTEGSALDMRGVFDRHAMLVRVSAAGPATYKVQLQGTWSQGEGWPVLAELDQDSAPQNTTVLTVVDGKPCRWIRAVLVVTSGSASARVSVNAEE